jgi:hypothetical protein
MRVVGGNAAAVAAPGAEGDGSPGAPTSDAAVAAEPAISLLLPVILFLIACAIGGSAVVLLRLA